MPNTPLHVAVQNGNIEVVKMLLEAGHDPSAVNDEGLTPQDIASQMGHTEIVDLFLADLFADKAGQDTEESHFSPEVFAVPPLKTQESRPVRAPQIALIGTEGSGKTVLTTVLAKKMSRLQNGVWLNPLGARTGKYIENTWHTLCKGEWVPSTPAGTLFDLKWVMQIGERGCPMRIIDSAGQDLRRLFSDEGFDDPNLADQDRKFVEYIYNSTILLVLINLRDFIGEPDRDKVIENQFTLKSVLDELMKDKTRQIAFVFTAYDLYEEVIQKEYGTVDQYIEKELPYLHNAYVADKQVMCFPVAAVADTEEVTDREGIKRRVPAPNFGSKGLESLIAWLAAAVTNEMTRPRPEPPNAMSVPFSPPSSGVNMAVGIAIAVVVAFLFIVVIMHGGSGGNQDDFHRDNDILTVLNNGTSGGGQYPVGEREFAEGLTHLRGEGVPVNKVKAVECFRKAADMGHDTAQFALGLCYANGDGVRKDMTEAINWYRKAAEQGHAGAQLYLGLCYARGEGVGKDMAEAAKLYRKAADQGDANAQRNLGICYLLGEGVSKNEITAEMWLRKAGDQGDESALEVLAEMRKPQPEVIDNVYRRWYSCNEGIWECWEHRVTAEAEIRNEGANGNITVIFKFQGKTASKTEYFNKNETKTIRLVIGNLSNHTDDLNSASLDCRAAGQ
jgi:GTPase SAR1 family protein